MSLLGSWVDATVVMNQNQDTYAFMHLFMKDGAFLLEVTVLQDQRIVDGKRDSLISELAYAITRLDRDMWEDNPVKHEVLVCLPLTGSPKISLENTVPAEGDVCK